MTEQSRKVEVQIVYTPPKTFPEWRMSDGCHVPRDDARAQYARYRDRVQPYRWRAVGANNEPLGYGESYGNEADCIDCVNLLFGDNTTASVVPMYGFHRGEVAALRYGVTDRVSQARVEIDGTGDEAL